MTLREHIGHRYIGDVFSSCARLDSPGAGVVVVVVGAGVVVVTAAAAEKRERQKASVRALLCDGTVSLTFQ